MRPLSALLACLLAAALALAPVARAQDTATATAPDAKQKIVAQVIAVQDIPARADADELYAEQILALAQNPGEDTSTNIGARLDRIFASTHRHARQYRFDELKLMPAPRLESLERYWRFEARRFEAVRKDLRDASGPYTDATAELARRRADWAATQAAAGQQGISGALMDRADGVVALLQRASERLSEPLARQLQLGRHANALDAEIQAGRKAVSAAIGYSDRRLARIDSPPLWRVPLHAQGETDALASARLGMQTEAAFLGEYGTANFGNQRALQVFQLLLLPVLLWLGWRQRRRERAGTGVADAASARVLKRPFSTWLLLAMLGVLVFEPDAPLLAQQVAMLLALVPLLRLLPVQSRQLLGPWPYAATALYLLNRLAFVLLGNLFLYRWYYFGLTVFAMAVTGWLYWRSRHLNPPWLHGHAGALVRAFTWSAMAVLLVSALANLFGNLTLAEMLTSALIDSGYMALVLFVGVTVALALLGQLFPRGDLAQLRIARDHAPKVARMVSRILALAAVVGWVVYTANRFRVYRPVYASLEQLVTHELKAGEISISLGSVLVFVAGVALAIWLARLVRFLLREEVLPNMSLPRGVDNSVASLTYYALVIVGLLAALAAAGVKVGQLAFLFGAMGVGIGLGLQDVVKNFVSGLILMFERPIQPGDVVEISGTSGRVQDIGMRATTIKTFDGADVVVPNGTLLSEKFTNWTLRDQHRRLDIDIGVAYGSDPDQVSALLLEVVAGTEGVADTPAPAVLFSGFGASSLDFSVRAWTHDFDNWPSIRSAVAARLYAALVNAGIEIPFPQQDLHLRSVSEEIARSLQAPATHAAGGEPPPQQA
jgi:small-conductance mechanosensitive channel